MLRRLPALYRLARLFQFLGNEAWFAGWVWAAPGKWMDLSHLRRSWDFESPANQHRHSRILTLVTNQIGGKRWGDALEIGCSEGVFTSHLGRRCRSVSACDISLVARTRAAERCAQYPNVRIDPLDLARDEIPGQYDLVFAMDILSCVRGRKRLAAAAAKLAKALRSDGLLVLSDCSMPLDIRHQWGSHRWWGRRLAMMEGDDYVKLLESHVGLRLVYREEYVPEGGRLSTSWDVFIALFKKAYATGAGAGTEPVGDSVASVARPA